MLQREEVSRCGRGEEEAAAIRMIAKELCAKAKSPRDDAQRPLMEVNVQFADRMLEPGMRDEEQKGRKK